MELQKFLEEADPAFIERMERLTKGIMDQQYPASMIAPFVNSRVLNYWVEEAELLKKWKEKGWRKFSFLEIVWLKVISDLREFGVSFDLLKKLKDQLFLVYTHKEALQILESKRKDIQDLLNKGTLNADAKYMHEVAMKLKDVAGEIEDVEIMPMLAYMILIIVIYRVSASLVINKEGACAVFLDTSAEMIVINEKTQLLLENPHISIPLADIIESFILKDEIDNKLHMDLFSEDEWKIIEVLRREKPSSVKVKYNGNREIDLIEVTKTKKVDLAHRLSNIILKGGYETISVTTQKGKIVSCTQTFKLKIK